MAKKRSLLIAVCVLLVAGVYFYLYKDWFAPTDIQIIHTVRRIEPPRRDRRSRTAEDESRDRVVFGFSRKLSLTELKVIPLSELETNKNARPIWHLVSDSNSVPIKGFVYGERISGMKPYVVGARPDPLEPNTTYRLIVEAGSVKAEHDFKAAAKGGAGR